MADQDLGIQEDAFFNYAKRLELSFNPLTTPSWPLKRT